MHGHAQNCFNVRLLRRALQEGRASLVQVHGHTPHPLGLHASGNRPVTPLCKHA